MCDAFARVASRQAVTMELLALDGEPTSRVVERHIVDDKPGPPRLPPDLRTCGNTHAGGGHGWHVIRNSDNVWQRIEWSTAPVLAEVKALPADAYPIAMPDGSLCAWATQSKPRAWLVKAMKSSTVVEAVLDREHPPASCAAGGEVQVEREDGTVLVALDGTIRRAPAPSTQLSMSAPAPAKTIAHEVTIVQADGSTRTVPLAADRDLAGNALPPGAARTRVSAADDGAGTVLVAERFALKDCQSTETLSLVNIDTGVGRLIKSGDLMFLRLAYSIDRFTWIEAKPVLVDVSGG